MTELNATKLDAWITGNYGDDRFGGRYPAGAEDYLGQKVVVGQNDYGLGHWGTIISFEEWTDTDEDTGQVYGSYDLIVEHKDGSTSTITPEDADLQLRSRK